MESTFRDLRYGARSLRKSPALSLIAILALTLGIGLTTTMFSIVYGALMRGLPFERPERIMHLEANNLSRGIQSLEVGIHDFQDWRAQQKSFEHLSAFYTGTVNVSGTEKADRYDGAFISANAFRLLRVQPVLGRAFNDGEDSPTAPFVVLLGYQMWQDRYGGDAAILGQAIRVNGEPATVVGVMPKGFAFPIRQAMWVPLRLDPLALERGQGQSLEVFGRLRDGVSVDQASLEMNGIAKRLGIAYPKTNEGVGVSIKPFTEEYIDGEPQRLLYTMLGAVGFVLLIACANVANLLLGRAAFRGKEVGIRTALGASRAAVIRQFLAEALLLGVAGAVFGTGVAYAGVGLFNNALVDTQPPFWIDIKLDLPILLFVALIAVGASLLSGLLPALQASRADVGEILKDESRGSSSFRIGRLSKALVVFEIALSCGLLVAAGLTIKSVTKLRALDLGFPMHDLFTARVGLPGTKYASDTSRRQFFEQLDARIAALPGVSASTIASGLPALQGGRWTFAIEGTSYARPQDYPGAARFAVTPGYFATLNAPAAVEGRLLGPEDREGSLPVVVVNRSFVRKYFNGQSPLGRRIRLGGADADSTQPWLSIVGVVPDLAAGRADGRDPEGMYVPFAQHPAAFMSVIVRARGNPADLTPLVRDAVASLDRDLPIYFVRTLPEAIAQSTWFFRVFGTLFMVFGVVALFLAAIGLYAVMAFSVSRRTREVGVRMALGAQSGDVVRLIFRQGFAQVAAGMTAGLALALGVSQLLKIVLFDVNPKDPVVFAGVVLVLAATGLIACLVPARRATRVDPMVALRVD